MNLTLTRNRFCDKGIFGTLTDETGKQVCFTLEHSYENVPKLSPGTYTCHRRTSPEFGIELFQILGVPDFQGEPVTFIEIHIGNYNKDSKGCVLVGTGTNEDMITGSHTAFNALMTLQAGVDSFQLTVNTPTL